MSLGIEYLTLVTCLLLSFSISLFFGYVFTGFFLDSPSLALLHIQGRGVGTG